MTCSKCGKDKLPTEMKHGLSQCLDCVREYAREYWRKRHPKAAPQKATEANADAEYPRMCDFCHSPCKSETAYKRHMQLVHNKAA